MLKQLKVIYFYVTCYPTSNASTDEILHDIIAFVATNNFNHTRMFVHYIKMRRKNMILSRRLALKISGIFFL